MTLLSQIEADATAILDDTTNGFSEQVVFKSAGNNGAGTFFDSFEESDDPRHMQLVIAKSTALLFDLDHGDLVERASDSQVFEIFGYKPDPDGTVTLTLRRSALSLT